MSEIHVKWVETGAIWMDEQDPEWYLKIDTDQLIMMSTHHCILGQAIGPDAYNHLYDECGRNWLIDHGFVSNRDMWIEEIEKRKNEKASS